MELTKDALQNKILEQAKTMGFTESEVYFAYSEATQLLRQQREVSHYEMSGEGGISFRGVYDNFMGYAYTEELHESSISFLLEEAKENALLMAKKDEVGLHSAAEKIVVSQSNQGLPVLTKEEEMQLLADVEAAAFAVDDDIESLDYCGLSSGKNTISIENSKGLSCQKEKSWSSIFVSVIARRGDDVKTASGFFKGKNLSTCNPKALGEAVAKKALSYLGSESVPSGTYKVVLHAEVMASLLGGFTGVFFAENCQKGLSLLDGKVGETIASEAITLRDDPLLDDGYASTPFDSEGVKGRNKAVVQNGVLSTLLYHRESAKKDGVESTGNGFKAGFRGTVKTGSTNFYITNGDTPLPNMLAEMNTGLLITEISGLHAGLNSVSGEFSLSAQGFFIEDGAMQYGVEQIIIAGNFFDVLKDITLVGNDLFFLSSGKGAPSVYLETMSVAGANA